MTGPGSAVGDADTLAPPFWHRRSVHVALGALVVYVVLVCLIFWPIGPFDASRLPNGVLGDPDEMTWFVAWTPWALTHGHNLLFTHALDLPQGVNLANNTSVPFLGLLAAPITFAFGPIAAVNLLLRLAIAASATASYFVFRRWCAGEIGPFFGGLIFGFSPALLSHLHAYGHLDLVFVPLIPIMIALLDELVVRQRRSPVKLGALLGIVAAAQYLVSAELFADAVLLGVIAIGWLACRHPSQVKDHLRYTLLGAAAGIVFFAVLAGYPIYLALFGPDHLGGPVQAISHLQAFRTDLAESVVPDARQLLFPHRLAQLSAATLDPVRRAGGSAELGGYLGLPLLVTTTAVAIAARRSAVVGLASLLAAASFIASLGSRLQVAGHVTTVPLPEVVLAKLPLFDNVVPARFSIFVALFVALALAVGTDRALTLEYRHQKTRVAACGLVLAGLGASVATLVPHLPVSTETTALGPGVATTVHDLVPTGAVVLAYPYPQPPYAEAMLWQASDDFEFKLLGGYANVESAGNKGQIFPPLVEPAYVQEFLSAAESPTGHDHYPHPASVSDPDAELCSFIRANHVTAVVYQASGPGAASVRSLFSDTLAKPTGESAGLTVWVLGASRDCAQKP
jgi:hypothetical protein